MNTILTVLGCASLGFALWQGASGNLIVVGTAFLTGLAFLLFGNLDKIAVFKASIDGFEAQTRARMSKAESEITDLKELTRQIRAQIDQTPYFIHGRLPFVGQAILRYLYQGKELVLDEFCCRMEHVSSRKEIEDVVAQLRDDQGWIKEHDGVLRFTKKGEEAVKSYIELTIVRAF